MPTYNSTNDTNLKADAKHTYIYVLHTRFVQLEVHRAQQLTPQFAGLQENIFS